MSAGTLTLTTNSDVVTGTGTNFSTELAAGDFAVVVVGGITYTLPVKSVDSATKLTLVSKYPGPSQNGLAWSAVPRATQNLITAAVVAQATEALRGLNYDKQNWQQVFSGTGTITVKLPDGTTYTGPSWNGIASSLSGKMERSQNLNDVADKSASRTNLGLGSSATRNAYSSSGSMLSVGDFGLGGTATLLPSDANLNVQNYFNGDAACQFYMSGNNLVNNATGPGWHDFIKIEHGSTGSYKTVIETSQAGILGLMVKNGPGAWANYVMYGTGNTTKASDGTLKSASPVARIVNSREENQRTDIAEDGFSWCGCGTANAEAEGINIARLDVGVYIVTGSSGLASSGWKMLPPMDPAGMGELGIVEAQETESGGLTVRLFRRKYILTEEGEMVKTKGEPIDVPTNSWIDVRLDMPESSIWNKKAAQTSQEQQEKEESQQP